jgi:porphobilinogen synthase
MPFFVRDGQGINQPISSMPGHSQVSPDLLLERCREVVKRRLGGVILFGIPDKKDEHATGAYDERGVIPRAVRLLKEKIPALTVITDVCLCEYMTHGHCGVVRKSCDGAFYVDNDATLDFLGKTALTHARAGADIVAPSDMMDGRVGFIRRTLDEAGFHSLPIMSYAVKYASSFYAPFREAAESAPEFGDRRSYQMDPANSDEALREAALDIEEGADIVMVKPALSYGDVIRRIKERFNVPVAAYNVSGEYAMVKAAAAQGWIDERAVVREMLISLRRAGADIIVTYWAMAAAGWLEDV